MFATVFSIVFYVIVSLAIIFLVVGGLCALFDNSPARQMQREQDRAFDREMARKRKEKSDARHAKAMATSRLYRAWVLFHWCALWGIVSFFVLALAYGLVRSYLL